MQQVRDFCDANGVSFLFHHVIILQDNVGKVTRETSGEDFGSIISGVNTEEVSINLNAYGSSFFVYLISKEVYLWVFIR